MRPLEHHELGDVARAVTDELDDHVDVAVEEARLGLSQERQRGAGLRDECLAAATDASEVSRPLRPKYHTLALLTRARAHIQQSQTAAAIADARHAVNVAASIDDPALRLQAMAVLLTVDGSEALLSDARTLVDRITSALPDGPLRQRFVGSEAVARVRSL